jgi:uncharacterized phage protein (TIGR01671 family)
MEDRYLFKAKRVDDGEWVQGCYIYNIDRDCSESLNKFAHRIQPLYAHAYAEPIDPTTICQCTGLKDKNGKLIWENDIMVAHLDDEYPEDETYIRILWRGSGFCSKENGSEDIAPIDKFDREHFEVIGNIFDNKDSLESEK